MKGIVVRAATRKDLEPILEVEAASFPPHEAFTARQVRGLIANQKAVVLVAEHKGAVIAWAVGLVRQHAARRSGRVYSIAVQSRHRGRGIGNELLKALTVELEKRGAKRIFLEVRAGNGAAIRMYERFGFNHLGLVPDYYAKGVAAVKMVRAKQRVLRS